MKIIYKFLESGNTKSCFSTIFHYNITCDNSCAVCNATFLDFDNFHTG